MLDNTTIPDIAGLRPWSVLEREKRAEAMGCYDLKRRPGTPDCSQNIWLSFFFDGTGNNRKEDTPKSKHSNVVRLLLSHEDIDELLAGINLHS